MSIVAIDLFCGTGGLTHGLLQAGIEVKAGYDIASQAQFAYEYNNSPAVFIHKSVTDILAEDVKDILGTSSYTLIAGCAPCQPFSALNRGKKVKGKDWSLLQYFGKLVEETQPTFVTMENVPQLRSHEIYQVFYDLLKNNGYSVNAKVVYCPDYGIPQKRRRLVLIASKLGDISFPKPTHTKEQYVTVRDTIGKLPPLAAGECNSQDPLHWASEVSELNKRRLDYSKPGGSWEDWPEELVAKCHKDLKVKNYRSAYGRMTWDEPSPTITTQFYGVSHGRFAHPEQNRPISMREAAMLQTFPRNYAFFPSGNKINRSDISRMIGNAVPVRLGEVVGRAIFEHLHNYV